MLVLVHLEMECIMSNATSSDMPEIVADNHRAIVNINFPAGLEQIGSVVDYNNSPSFNSVAFRIEAESEVSPGQFLAVWHGHRPGHKLFTIIQVKNCFEHNPNEEPGLSNARNVLNLSASYAREGVSTRIFRLALCETIEEFKVNDYASWEVTAESAPTTLCRAGYAVVHIPPALCQKAVGSLDDPQMGFELGKMHGPQTVPIILKPDIAQMHIGVFGNPGKGKSYLSGVLLEELMAWNIPTLVLDVNGETIEAARSLGGECITLPNKSEFGLPLSLLTPSELIMIAPNVQPGTQYAELIEIAHDELRSQAKKTGKEVTFDALIAEMERRAPLLELKPATVRTAVSRLSALSTDPLIGEKFNLIDRLIKNRLIVLDCRYLSLTQTRLIAASAARTLQKYGREMTKKANNGDMEAQSWLSTLYIDEAHSVAPASESVVSTQVLYELARMGRHVRTGLILASQSPSDLDRSILKRLQTRFVFALERDQLQAINGVSADLGEEIMAALPKLPRGVCAVSGSSELIRHGFLLNVRQRRTPVGGSTPPVFAQRVKKRDA